MQPELKNNNLIFFNIQYYKHGLFFLIFLIAGCVSYFQTNLQISIFQNISLLVFAIFSIIAVQKFHSFYFLKIYKFDFLTLNFIYILYILFFFFLGFFISNFHYTFFLNTKQIEQKIFIEEKLFKLENIIKHDLKKNYLCMILKEFETNEEQKFFSKKAKIKFCTHSKFLKDLSIKNSILNIRNFEINPIRVPIYEYDYKIKRSYFFKNIIGEIYSNNLEILPKKNENPSFFQIINNFRYKKSLKLVETFGQENGGIIAALIYGTRIFIDKDINENMRKSSMLHLVAISGLHISFISILFFKIIFLSSLIISFYICRNIRYFLLKKISLILSLIMAFSYLCISGFTISAQRAFFMFFIYTIYNFCNLQIIFSKIIFLSVLMIAIISPYEFFNPGLQMSFFAVLGLFLFLNVNYHKQIKNEIEKLNLSKWISWVLFFISKNVSGVLAPHLFTMPISAFYFNQISTYTFFSNIFAVPLMSMIIAPLIILFIFFGSFFARLSHYIQILINLSINFLNQISDFFANCLPFNSLHIEQISNFSFIFLLSGLSLIFIWKRKMKFLGMILIFIGILNANFQKTTSDIFIYKTNNQINYLFFDKDSSKIYFVGKKIDFFLKEKFGKKYKILSIEEKQIPALFQKENNMKIKFQNICLSDKKNNEKLFLNKIQNICSVDKKNNKKLFLDSLQENKNFDLINLNSQISNLKNNESLSISIKNKKIYIIHSSSFVKNFYKL